MRTCVVCIAKNEDRTIEEWIDYHFKLGFDTIFMYQNDWVCKIDRENLVKSKCSGKGVQLRFYNNWLRVNYKNFDWAAFIDCDEYIVLHKHKNVKDFLSIEKFQKENGIAINWHVFGSCGQDRHDNSNSFLKRFTFRGSEPHRLIKVILNLKNIDPNKTIFISPHNISLPVVDTNGGKIRWAYNVGGPTDLAQVNHYYYKSKEEWLEKLNRGNQYIKKNMEQWEEAVEKYKEVKDLTAFDFMYGS